MSLQRLKHGMPNMSLQRLRRCQNKMEPAKARNCYVPNEPAKAEKCHAKNEPAEAKNLYSCLAWNLQRDNSFSLGSGRRWTMLRRVCCFARVLQRREFFSEGVLDFCQICVHLLLAALSGFVRQNQHYSHQQSAHQSDAFLVCLQMPVAQGLPSQRTQIFALFDICSDFCMFQFV